MIEAANPNPGQSETPAAAVSKLFDEAAIAARVTGLAQEISPVMPEAFTVVGLLKGSFVFVADLVRALDRAGRRPRVDFITLSSYGLGRESSGRVRLIGAPPEDISGRAVLLVDDVVDTGRSLDFARDPAICCCDGAPARCGAARCSTNRRGARSR